MGVCGSPVDVGIIRVPKVNTVSKPKVVGSNPSTGKKRVLTQMPCRSPSGGRDAFDGTEMGMGWSAEVMSILWVQFQNPPCEAKVVGSDPGTGKQEIGTIIIQWQIARNWPLTFTLAHNMSYITFWAITWYAWLPQENSSYRAT